MDTNRTAAVLEDLYQTLQDGRQGFDTAADKLQDEGHGDIAGRLREFSSQRQRLAGELINEAGNNGIRLDVDAGNGSAAGALHRGWMSMKDALTGNDAHAILAAAERGEDHAVKEYEKAMDEELPASVRSLVNKQAMEVKSAHDTVRELRDAHA